MRRARVLFFLAGLLSVLNPSLGAQDGGIEIFAGETLFSQGTRVSLAHLYTQKTRLYDGSKRVSDPLDRKDIEHRTVLGLNYGLTSRITLAALLPYVDRRSTYVDQFGLARAHGRGLGDVALIGKYRMYTQDWSQGSFNVAVIGGVETPTGDRKEHQDGRRVPADKQVGSGSWDPFGALAVTASQGRFRLDLVGFGKWNTEGAQSYDDSDVLSGTATLSYRFYHAKYPGPSHSVRLGAVWRHFTGAEENGHRVANKGGNQLLLRSGMTFHPSPEWDITFNVDVPLYQRYRGTQLGLDVRGSAAVGLRF